MAISSLLFEPICANLTASNIDLSQARVVLLEKPLGHDLLSSHVINDAVTHVQLTMARRAVFLAHRQETGTAHCKNRYHFSIKIPSAILPMPFGQSDSSSNRLVIRLQLDESIQLHCLAKQPGPETA